MAGSFDRTNRAREFARIALAGIGLLNGTAALFAPTTLARRLGFDPEANPAALYVLRLSGVRTVLIGPSCYCETAGCAAHSLRVAPFIHALDAIAAVSAGAGRQLPRRAATTAALISTVNTVLAVLAQTRRVGGRNGR